MISGIIVLVLTLIFGGASTFAVFFLIKRFRGQITSAGVSNKDEAKKNIAKYDDLIANAIAAIGEMLPLSQVTDLEKELEQLDADLAKEQDKLKKLETALANNQQQVDGQESRHNELKQGKDECLRVADEVRANQESLQNEHEALASQLIVSKEQMESLAADPSLSDEQKKALEDVQGSLNSWNEQLINLGETYNQAQTRFFNLQTQYDELENEYRKLVDKELSGTY